MKIAVVTNLPTHYRRPLFERLAEVHDATFFFTHAGEHRYWSGDHELSVGTLRARPGRSRVRVCANLVTGSYDCLVASMTGRLRLLLTLAAARIAGTPVVLWVGIWEHPRTVAHRLSRRLVAALYRHVDAIVVYGPHVARHIERESGRTEGVFEAVQAVDDGRFRTIPLSRAPHRVTACFVGRLEPEKGLDCLLRALALVPQLRLVVAGSGRELGSLEALTRELAIADRVRFGGYVPQARLPSLLADVDLLVLPSVTTATFKEPWGLVVNEAMSAGLPVVTTSAVGAVAGGLVLDGRTGIVVPERDVDGLAVALRRLMVDPALRARLGAAARERVRCWNYDAALRGLDAAIHAAVGERA
jgi:glycosyltransferase involved in cell wall biosynthesis